VSSSPPSPASHETPLHGRHVLIVEDEALIAMVVQDALAAAGGTHVWAGDGGVAMAAFRAEPFDAAVVNLGLPDRKGADLIVEFRAARPLLPVVVITGSAATLDDSDPMLLSGTAPGAVLEKPFDPAVLVETLARLIAEAERRAS
jgi:DNA-binding response OmpR family regulator